jgi:hypothetical protein
VSKVLAATCVAGIVKVGALVVPAAEVLSEGVASSSGIVILDEDKAYYVAENSPDLKSTIEKVIDSLEDLASVLNTIATTLTSIGAGMTGPTTAPPPTLAVNVATIISKAAEITASRAELLALKGALK